MNYTKPIPPPKKKIYSNTKDDNDEEWMNPHLKPGYKVCRSLSSYSFHCAYQKQIICPHSTET